MRHNLVEQQRNSRTTAEPGTASIVSLEQLGNLGEFIASIGVLLSLAYLAVQVRQNTRALDRSELTSRTSIETALSNRFFDFRRDLYSDPELARIYFIGLTEPNQLAQTEWTRFQTLLQSLVFAMGEQTRLSDELLFERASFNEAFFEDFFRYPGARLFWRENINFDPDFGARIQDVFERTEVSSPDELLHNPSPWLSLAPKDVPRADV